ncbi:hypothetical protein HPMKM1_0155 [Helicobacter pylori]|nr:hypothetical protein HPMKM1_0155 [Helicobacter pylori]
MIPKTLPIPYEVCYQTKFKKNNSLKVREWLKSPKLKRAKSRESNYKLSKTF